MWMAEHVLSYENTYFFFLLINECVIKEENCNQIFVVMHAAGYMLNADERACYIFVILQ